MTDQFYLGSIKPGMKFKWGFTPDNSVEAIFTITERPDYIPEEKDMFGVWFRWGEDDEAGTLNRLDIVAFRKRARLMSE